ncbi:MAG: DUF4824 family protein [Pseudomonadota bacterium]
MMTRTRFIIAGTALILATNLVALAGVAYNHSGEPESILKLSQRELSLPYYAINQHDNSGISLSLRWRTLHVGSDTRNGFGVNYASWRDASAWLDQAKLAALGFDVSKPVDSTEGRLHYNKLLSKEVLLVLELDGAAYQSALARAKEAAEQEQSLFAANPDNPKLKERAKTANDRYLQETQKNSRLFAIDAGLDNTALRAKYADRTRYLIVRGQVRPQLNEVDHKPHLTGYISRLSIEEVNVPLSFRPLFEPMLRESGRRTQSVPHYEVTLTYGKRLEPWISAVHVKAGAQ